jgi:hypothetical protein
MKRQRASFRRTSLVQTLAVLSASWSTGLTFAQTSQTTQNAANAQVLQSWQQQTGQAASVNAQGGVEFHGSATVDAYTNKVSSPSGNPALSPLQSNDFGKLVFQGDIRTQSAEQDITYAQGVLTSTNDRSVMARYANQINSFQTGRAGQGYQFAFGDVVANYSTLSSNLGLRGLLAARQFGALTVTGVAGTVAESWEALLNRSALDNLAPRTRYLRDVMGIKAEYAFDQQLSAFATLQNYADRISSAPLPLGSPALSGTVLSTGLKYAKDTLQISAELAASTTEDKNTLTDRHGKAVVIDGTYRFAGPGVSLRFGYHDLGPRFASLTQSVAPGIQEWYAGGDWQITPQLNWGVDLRDATTRIPATLFTPAGETQLQSFSNRLSYSFQDFTGLMLGLSDTRNQGKDALGNTNLNDTTQISLNYGSQLWTGGLSVGQGHSRSPAFPTGDSNSSQWQLSLGRNWSDASVEKQASWTVGLQSNFGQQTQKQIVAGTASKNTSYGLNLTASSTPFGQLLLGLQRQQTEQPTPGAPRLATTTINLDWTKALTQQWQLKGYAKINRRNHGDIALQIHERILGVQGSYKW